VKPTFQGEVQFASYGDSSRGGPRVTLRLADRDELERFIGKEGKRFACVLVEIADDETPAEPEKPAPARKAVPVKRHGPLCQWAVERCGEPVFQSWLRPQYDRAMGGNGSGWGDVTPMDDFKGNHAEYAAHCIKVICMVDSRKEFDTDPAAGQRFKDLVMRPYSEWLKTQAGQREAVPA
jgi:hypothetical protein